MFQSYYDVDKDVVITSKSAEATANCYCQEYDLSSKEFQKMYQEEKEVKEHKNLFKRFTKWLRKKVEKE